MDSWQAVANSVLMSEKSQAKLRANESDKTVGSLEPHEEAQRHADAVMLATVAFSSATYANPTSTHKKPPVEDQRAKQQESQLKMEQPSKGASKIPSSPLVTPPIGSNIPPASPSSTPPVKSNNGTGVTANPQSQLPQLPSQPISTLTTTGVLDNTNNIHTQQQHLPPPPHAAATTRRGIPHVYQDFSSVSGPGPAFMRKKTGGVTQPFPEKLHEMLSCESGEDPSSAVVSWLPHGRAFIVRRPREFTADIMPKYFRQTKLTSFQRQLNLYGFRRLTVGPDAGAYYHQLFLRGRPSLSQRMVRQKVKGTFRKQPADASSEPNFYTMPLVQVESIAAAPDGARYKATILPPSATESISDPSTTTQHPPALFPDVSSSTASTGAPSTASGTRASRQTGKPPSLETSPSIASVHAGAHLLQGIAAGFRSGPKRDRAFLGPAADSSKPTPIASSAHETSSSLLQPNAKEDNSVQIKQRPPASFMRPDQPRDAE